MKVINFAKQNTIINQYVAELRDVNIQKDRARFRYNLSRIGQMMAYEISKTLQYSEKTIQTPLAKAKASTADNEIVLGTIFRAGLPFHQGFLDVFDNAGNAFVSAYRYYKDKECKHVGIKIEYIATPDLTDKTLIIADPMLATGGSSIAAIQMLKDKGCKNIHFMCIIAAPEGVEAMKEAHPDVDMYIGALDEKLNDHGYIVPGLGDAGDRIFGTK